MNKKKVILFLTTALLHCSSVFADEITLTGPSPYLGIPTTVPGLIEVENFDLGGQNVAFYDSNPDFNEGETSYRDENVDLYIDEVDGSYALGWVTEGEWLIYTVDVAQAGIYELQIEAAVQYPERTVSLYSNGTLLLDKGTMPLTGSYTIWDTGIFPNISLQAGVQQLKFEYNGSQNIKSYNLVLVKAQPNASAQDASRLLSQAAFGPSMEAINQVRELGIEAWIDNQLTLTPSYHSDITGILGRRSVHRWVSFWETAVYREDQLRQRMAYALSQIFVVSDKAGIIVQKQNGLNHYYDVLVKHGLGNFRDLLTDVSKHPIMAHYLTYAKNEKANEEGTTHPDQNYARELLQLMSIGLFQLELDGSTVHDELGQPVPAYNQDIIEEFAEVFTGWCYQPRCDYRFGDYTLPLVAKEWMHDTSEKILLNGTVLPAGQTTEEDLVGALNNIFAHPNVGPFISKLLIQRLVTSNPTPDYIQRVASVFNDNGAGVRGDLAQVAKAILMDKEARQGHIDFPDTFGKMREPILRMTHLYRALDSVKGAGSNIYYKLEECAGQSPLGASSVFNFYHADFKPHGLPEGMVAPEFGLNNETQIIKLANCLYPEIRYNYGDGRSFGDRDTAFFYIYSNFVDLLITEGDEAFLDRIDLLFTEGRMSLRLRQKLLELISALRADGVKEIESVANVILLISISPEFVIQH